MYQKKFDPATKISRFPNVLETKCPTHITLDESFDETEFGKYQDIVLPIQVKAEREGRESVKEDKKQVPLYTFAGMFSERNNQGLIDYSHVLLFDIDNLAKHELLTIKTLLKKDRHSLAVFVSISGTGLCLAVLVEGNRYQEYFEAYSEYLFTNYQIIIDPSCKDVSRARFVSYDPDLYRNYNAVRLTLPAKKGRPAKERKIADFVHVENDFTAILSEIQSTGMDIVPGYHNWRNVGFAISDKFGESGRTYFHIISANSPEYNPPLCDKQYTACLNAKGQGIHINTFYYICKEAGLSIMSERTREILKIANNSKKVRTDQTAAKKLIVEISGIPDGPDVDDIINQVFSSNIQSEDENDIEAAELWLKQNCKLRKNEITGKIENNGKPLTDYEINSLELELKKILPKLDYSTTSRLFNSKVVPMYHPIKSFFAQNNAVNPTGVISQYLSCITAVQSPEYILKFITKWIVGIVANVYEATSKSPLMPILCGKPGIGKSYFFEKLLPEELSDYVAMKNLSLARQESSKKDLEILCSSKLLIVDDELAGNNKRENEGIKALLSAGHSNVRGAYARTEETRQRIASFAGTSNVMEILTETSEDRRFIPVEVLSIDWNRIGKIDRVELLMEAYHLYRSGFEYRVLGSEITELNAGKDAFEVTFNESELVGEYFRKPNAGEEGDQLTGSAIQERIQKLTIGFKLDFRRIKAGLEKIGVTQQTEVKDGKKQRLYRVVDILKYQQQAEGEKKSTLPF